MRDVPNKPRVEEYVGHMVLRGNIVALRDVPTEP
jgi:hypothetical protein